MAGFEFWTATQQESCKSASETSAPQEKLWKSNIEKPYGKDRAARNGAKTMNALANSCVIIRTRFHTKPNTSTVRLREVWELDCPWRKPSNRRLKAVVRDVV